VKVSIGDMVGVMTAGDVLYVAIINVHSAPGGGTVGALQREELSRSRSLSGKAKEQTHD
jgi:hypothetical protein